MRMTRAILMACCVAAGCLDWETVGPSAPLDQEFTLARGETAAIGGTPMRLQFVEVTGDSRCPADALCIQGGDAIVHVRALETGTTSDYMLHTGDSARSFAMHRQFRVELVQLMPYPFSSRIIAPDDYRATLKVTAP